MPAPNHKPKQAQESGRHVAVIARMEKRPKSHEHKRVCFTDHDQEAGPDCL